MILGIGKRNGDVHRWWGQSVQEMCGLQDTLYPPKFAVSNCLNCYFFAKSFLFSYATSCAPCAKAKAACKPFNVDKTQAKAKAETARR